jgi:hypothetical protein
MEAFISNGSLAPLAVVGFVPCQSKGKGGAVMRRFARIDIVLMYRYTKKVTFEGGECALPGQQGAFESLSLP